MYKDIKNSTTIKTLFSFFIVVAFSILFSSVKSSYAALSEDETGEISPIQSGYSSQIPLSQAFIPIVKIANAASNYAGIVFVIMLGIGAIKLAAAQGDPKGFEGAGRTWLFATLGVFIVFAALTFLKITGRIFGIDSMIDADNIIENARNNTDEFVEELSDPSQFNWGGLSISLEKEETSVDCEKVWNIMFHKDCIGAPNVNCDKWWNKLTRACSTGAVRDQPPQYNMLN